MYRGLGNCLESVLKRNLWTQREVFKGSSSSYRWLVIAADEDGVVMIQCLPAPHTTPSPSPSLSLRVDLCYFCKEMSYDEVCKQVILTLLKS